MQLSKWRVSESCADEKMEIFEDGPERFAMIRRLSNVHGSDNGNLYWEGWVRYEKRSPYFTSPDCARLWCERELDAM